MSKNQKNKIVNEIANNVRNDIDNNKPTPKVWYYILYGIFSYQATWNNIIPPEVELGKFEIDLNEYSSCKYTLLHDTVLNYECK
jgi:hypothetical protein